jgi:hypothetical protein
MDVHNSFNDGEAKAKPSRYPRNECGYKMKAEKIKYEK